MSGHIAPPTLTLRSVGDVAETLRAALAHGGALTLDLAQVQECDALGFQLVEAALTEAGRSGASLTVVPPETEAVQWTLARLGVSPASHPHWFGGQPA